ncbi:uncharacterized protein BN804_00382 [Firmicutes bacterium CAG:884]|nr:uncharacterized protein BN804_00382 [Firmicutes bacterium CAG:884]
MVNAMKSIYTNLKDYIMENEFCIHIFEDRINIVNYTGIYGFDNNNVVIKHKKGSISIKGLDLTICKLLDNEILISGKIDKIEFR